MQRSVSPSLWADPIPLNEYNTHPQMRVECQPGYGQIYLIEPRPSVSKSDSKGYVGQNATSLYSRVSNHTSQSSSCVRLSNALKAHGLHNFTIRRLQRGVPKEELDDAEIHWVAKLDTWHNGYNCGPGGGVGNIMQDEKVRANHKAALARPEVKANFSAAGKKRMADPDVRAKFFASLENAYTPEVRERKSKACKKLRQDPVLELQRGFAKRATQLEKRAKKRATLKTEKERRAFDSQIHRQDRYNAKSGRSMTMRRIIEWELAGM